MTHISFQPHGRAFECSSDYVVIGSGAGGAAAAVALARAGADVTIVEAGPWREPKDYPTSAYGALRDLFEDWGSNITRGRAFWPVVQARVMGGTTVVNSAICVRTPGDIFHSWRDEHGVGDDAIAEEMWVKQDQIERDLCTSVVSGPAAGRHNVLASRGSDALGFDGHFIKRYAKGCEGTGQCLQGCRALKKQSTNVTYVPEVMRLGGRVLSSAPVHRVVIEGRQAVGVTGHFVHPKTKRKGAKFTVRANKGVIVAASVTHSPLILKRSGIRNAALGHYFRSHPGSGVLGCYEDPVDMNTGTTQGWASLKFRVQPGTKLESLSLPLEMVASRLAGGGNLLIDRLQEYRHFAHWVHVCRANSAGRVTSGFGGRPVVHYTLDKADMHKFRQGIHLVAKLHFAAGAKAVVPCIHGMPYRLTADQVDLLAEAPLDPRAYVAVLSHLFGGCVMGADSSRSVCDSHGRVHGYDRLIVADASLFPTNLGVNPQHTIMSMAMLHAETMLHAA